MHACLNIYLNIYRILNGYVLLSANYIIFKIDVLYNIIF